MWLFSSCSTANLCKDTYLRQKMDDQGWVPVSLIAGFNKVSCLFVQLYKCLDLIITLIIDRVIFLPFSPLFTLEFTFFYIFSYSACDGFFFCPFSDKPTDFLLLVFHE